MLAFLVFTVIFKKIQINKSFFYLFGFFNLATPLLLNYLLIEWYNFPDQSNYLYHSILLRYSLLNVIDFYQFNINNFEIVIPGLYYAIFSLPFLETFQSIGISSRFLFYSLLFYLFSKRVINIKLLVFLSIIPSVTLYTSLGLRESLIIFSFTMLAYFTFIEKNYFFIIFFLILGIILKLYFVPIYIFYLLVYSYNVKKFKIYVSLLCTLGVILLIIFETDVVNRLNFYKYSLFVEDQGLYQDLISPNFYKQLDLPEILMSIPSSIILFVLAPWNLYDLRNTFLFIDITLFIILTYFYVKKNTHLILIISYVSLLLFYAFVFGFLIENGGTLHRFKTTFLIVNLFYVLIIGLKFKLINKK